MKEKRYKPKTFRKDTRSYEEKDMMCLKCENRERCAKHHLACAAYTKFLTGSCLKIPAVDEPSRYLYDKAMGV